MELGIFVFGGLTARQPAQRQPHGSARKDQARGEVHFVGVWAHRGIKRDDAEWNQRQERRVGDQGFAALLVPRTVCRLAVVGCVHDITARDRDAVDVPFDGDTGCDIRDAAACTHGVANEARTAGRVAISGRFSEYVRAKLLAPNASNLSNLTDACCGRPAPLDPLSYGWLLDAEAISKAALPASNPNGPLDGGFDRHTPIICPTYVSMQGAAYAD